MPNQFFLKYFGLLFLALGFLAVPVPVQAGFQWVAPSAPSEPQAPLPPVTAPAAESMSPPEATQQPEILRPSIESSNAAIGPAPGSMEPIIVGGRASPSISAPPSSNQDATPLAGSSSVVHGFAKQVPLAVALREILPPGYGFSIDSSVDMGVLVSFQGGRPWRETLRESLEPAGLVMREQGQMVSIGYPAPLPAASVPASVPAGGSNNAFSKPKPALQEHFLTLPPSMLNQSSSFPPPVIISGSGGSGVSPPLTPVANMVPMNAMAEGWDAERGDGLRKVLERWSRRANVELDWMSEYDYPLQASVHFAGTFEDAVRNLLTGFETAHPQPVAELHSNSRIGQTVLVVTTRGNAGE